MSASSEPRTRKVVLPDVVGLQLRDATTVLRNAGLTTWRVHYTEAYADEFGVVEQTPKSGQLVSTGQAIRLDVARKSMVGYLPQVYQHASEDSASLLKGLLYIVQHTLDSVGGRLDRIHELFDPRTADPEFLPWLASWLAITLSPDWDELQRRKMLLAATRLFPYRGTKHAIEEFVRIYTGASVTIEENTWPFAGFRIGDGSTVGDDAVILPPMNLAHCFVVRVDRPASEVPEDEIIKIHEIIQTQKPAHASYYLAFQDEEEAGEMGAFMTVGGAGIGIGVPAAEEGDGGAAPDDGGGDEVEEATDESPAKDEGGARGRSKAKKSDSGGSKRRAAEESTAADEGGSKAEAKGKGVSAKAASKGGSKSEAKGKGSSSGSGSKGGSKTEAKGKGGSKAEAKDKGSSSGSGSKGGSKSEAKGRGSSSGSGSKGGSKSEAKGKGSSSGSGTKGGSKSEAKGKGSSAKAAPKGGSGKAAGKEEGASAKGKGRTGKKGGSTRTDKKPTKRDDD